MSWVRIDDGLDEHPKTDALMESTDELRALAAIGLLTLSLASSSRRLTDGVVTPRTLRRLAPEHGLDLAQLLTAHNFFDECEDGHVIHDYLDYNPSRNDIEKKRKADAERKAKGRSTQGKKRVRKDSARTPNGVNPESSGPDPGPEPIPKDPPTPLQGEPETDFPVKPDSGRRREQVRFELQCSVLAARLFPDADQEQAHKAVEQAIRGGKATSDDQVVAFVERWWPGVVNTTAAAA